WTTATPPYLCGCAFSSDGLPCVAQRVWPMPVAPFVIDSPRRFSRFDSLPLARTTDRPLSPRTATPAESYPRYSSFRSPSTSRPAHCSSPTYPTMPHMIQVLPRLSSTPSSALSVRPTPRCSAACPRSLRAHPPEPLPEPSCPSPRRRPCAR